MRHGREVVDAWQFTIGIDRHSAQRVSEERAADARVTVLSAGAGWLRVEAIAGAPTRGSLLLIAGRGLFEVTRRDGWSVAGGDERVLLMLRTLPDALSAAAAERAWSASRP
jgi:hypothetical protein